MYNRIECHFPYICTITATEDHLSVKIGSKCSRIAYDRLMKGKKSFSVYTSNIAFDFGWRTRHTGKAVVTIADYANGTDPRP